MNSHVGMALTFAAERHREQRDKRGKPYLGHLLRVAARVADNEDAVQVVLLHDILEDTATRITELAAAGFEPGILAAVQLLTRDPEEDESYMDYIRRVRENPLAAKVKEADLLDNLDPARALPEELGMGWMIKRYRRALVVLAGGENETP